MASDDDFLFSTGSASFPSSPADARYIDFILRSGLFDARAYAQTAGLATSDNYAAAAHYLERGEREGLLPSEGFDPAFYATVYADVAQTGGNLLLHYVAYGRAEGRYATLAALREHADALRRSRKVKLHRATDAGMPSPAAGLTLLEYNLAGGWRGGARILKDLNDRFYHDAYADVRASGLPPAMHYFLIGQDEERLARPDQVEDRAQALRPHFDEAHYRTQLPELPAESDALVHYIVTGRYQGLDPSPYFSTETYLARYPDIVSDDVDPFLHFLQRGREEGRSDKEDFKLELGGRPFDAERPTLVIASHDASRTGAPLVALGLAQELAKTSNVILLVGRAGPLSADFRAISTQVGTGTMLGRGYERLFNDLRSEGRLDGAVLNSAQTASVAEGALYAGVPSVALVHEFAEDPNSKVRHIVIAADYVVVPAKLVQESTFEELSPIGRPNNLLVRHQGILADLPVDPHTADLTGDDLDALVGPVGQAKIVLGAGHVQIRKGVDLFVQTAGELRDRYPGEFRFLWVGNGYDAVRDPSYSLYVRETLHRLDLQDVVTFLPAQSDLDMLFRRADLFLLSSRLDPFPNVVIDAFEAGLPVVCFERATGIADEISSGRAVGAAVRFGSPTAAADAIADFLGKPKSAADANRRLIDAEFGFGDYVDFVSKTLDEARDLSGEIDRIASALDEANVFDAAFHEGQRHSLGLGLRPLRKYVAAGLKGLSEYNPRPGFSDNLYRSRRHPDAGTGIVPLLDALSRGDTDPVTHDCHLLDDEASLKPFRGKAALHLHLPRSDLAFDFARRLAGAATHIDVIVTTDGEKKRREIEYAFTDHRGGDVQVHLVPDRGRGMGPLLVGIRDVLRTGGHEVIGHLYGRRYPGADGIADERRRKHIIDLLIGDGRRMDRVLSLFNDMSTGLIFPEDRNAIGWTRNLALAEKLAARMTPVPLLPAFPYFPSGAMFWARVEVIELFWSLDLTMADLPAEPLPNDGTILDAMERMLPAACDATGLRWRTIHARGAGW